MTIRPAYTAKTWLNGGAPPLSAANVQVMDNEIEASSRIAGSIPGDFAGLSMRTHPDVDKETTQVIVETMDYCVMNDGEVVGGAWAGKTLNSGASGAGGLDAGAVANATWYAIYAIYDRDTDTRNLLLTKATLWVKSVAHDVTLSAGLTLEGSGAQTKLAMKFLAGTTGSCRWVSLGMTRNNSPVDGVKITIQADSGGFPSGIALATAYLDPTDWPDASPTWEDGNAYGVVARFPTSVSLTSGTSYWIVAERTGAASGTNNVKWHSGGAYADGTGASNDGTSWTLQPAHDFGFHVWLETAQSPTLPAGYDSSCLLGYVRTGSSADFNRFTQQDRTYREMKSSQAEVSDVRRLSNIDGKTPPSENRVVEVHTVLPPSPVRAYLWVKRLDVTRTFLRIGPGTWGYGVLKNEVSSIEHETYQRLEHASTSDGSQPVGWVHFDHPILFQMVDTLAGAGAETLDVVAGAVEYLR